MVLEVENLPVGNYMTAFPLSVLPEVSLSESVDFMARRGIGNLIVSDDEGNVLGILTERDILKEIVTAKNLPLKLIKDIRFSNFEKISPDISVIDAAKQMINKKSRLLVYSDDTLVGIVTASDLLRAFRKTYMSPTMDDVVSSNIYAVSKTTTIYDTCKILFEKGIGSVIVNDSNMYKGIFTERDLLYKVLLNRVNLDESIELYSTFPLITASDGILANEAASIMAEKNVKRLALTYDSKITGIVTARDIVDAYQSDSPRIKNY